MNCLNFNKVKKWFLTKLMIVYLLTISLELNIVEFVYLYFLGGKHDISLCGAVGAVLFNNNSHLGLYPTTNTHHHSPHPPPPPWWCTSLKGFQEELWGGSNTDRLMKEERGVRDFLTRSNSWNIIAENIKLFLFFIFYSEFIAFQDSLKFFVCI